MKAFSEFLPFHRSTWGFQLLASLVRSSALASLGSPEIPGDSRGLNAVPS